MYLCTNVVKNGCSFTTRNQDWTVFFVQIEIEDDDNEALQNTNSLELGLELLNSFFASKWRVLHSLSFTIGLWRCHSSCRINILETQCFNTCNNFLFSDFFAGYIGLGTTKKKTKSGCFKKQMLTLSRHYVFWNACPS
jgi:hypothetical protein